jgi:hypothetical protein
LVDIFWPVFGVLNRTSLLTLFTTKAGQIHDPNRGGPLFGHCFRVTCSGDNKDWAFLSFAKRD